MKSYGDLGVLLPLVYKMQVTSNKKYKVGILPHYVDNKKIEDLKDKLHSDGISYTILNIMKGHNCQELVDEMSECEYLITSTLHGLILGLSYNVKTIWMKFSNQVTGKDFKFEDFFSSLSYEYKPIKLSDHTDILSQYIRVPKTSILELGLNMLNKLPFYNSDETKLLRIEEWNTLIQSYTQNG